MAEQQSTQALFDFWKQQTEEGIKAWTRMAEQTQAQGQGADPAAFWRPFMDQGMAAWSKLLGQGPVTPDVMTQWKQFLDHWIAAWSKALEQAMGTENFAQALGKTLDQWLSVQGPAKKAKDEATEAALAAMGLPSRTQVTGIARQIMDLEDRLESLEDKLTALTQHLNAAPSGAPTDRGKGGAAARAKKKPGA